MSKNTLGLKKEDQEIIIKVLTRFPEIEEAIIFGSRALDNYKPGSDIDLALKGDVENIYLDVKSILNEETPLPYIFDVLNYNTIKNINLKKHVDNIGKHIYRKIKPAKEIINK